MDSDRKWDRRLGLLAADYDFTGKRVLDLGCNRGFFSFALAGMVESVLAIDADESFIRENREYAILQGITNVSFTRATITPGLITALPEFDVVLMLSLLHHILARSAKYAHFSASGDIDYCVDLLSGLASRTDTLLFEMGLSTEAYSWAARLPEMGSEPGTWIATHLLKPAGFRDIKVLEPTAFTGWLGPIRRTLAGRMISKPGRTRFTGRRILQTVTRFDPRDIRPLVLAAGQKRRHLREHGFGESSEGEEV